MDNLDIQIVDSLTVNLNQEEYSTEGQVLNDIDVYVEDEQLLFEAALTQDSINLYTRETSDIISFDTKEITDGISKLESLILKTSKESTLLAKFAELKLVLNTIDFTAIEQAIQDVENITAREDTLIQGVEDIIKAVKSIDFTYLESSIAEVKASISKIDFSSVESKVEEVGNKIDKIDTTDLAKEQTLLNKAEEIKQEVKDLQKIPNEIITLLENRYQFQVNYDGAELNNSSIIQSILGAIINREAIVTLTDNYVTALPNKKLTELGFTSLKKASFNKVTSIAGTILWGTKVENLSLPSLKSFGYQNFRTCTPLKTINLPALEYSGERDNAVFIETPNLIDIICGAKFQRSQFGFGGNNYGWNPTEAMRDDVNTLVSNEQDEFGNVIDNNRKQLLYNLRRHMAANLPQLTTEGYTIAFTPQMKEIIEADENTKAAFINKGWTIS